MAQTSKPNPKSIPRPDSSPTSILASPQGASPSVTPATLADLKPDLANARKHNPRNIGMIVDALHKVGAARSIVIDEDGKILAGNGVVEAAAEAGIERVQVIDADGNTIIAVRRTGLTPEQKIKLSLFDNRTAELADWNAEQIVANLESGIVLDDLFYKDELDEILAGLNGEPREAPEAQIDKAEELQKKWGTYRGQLWELPSQTVKGKFHRLLCGDSTNAEEVARLMGEEKAVLCVTSPPYWVEREYEIETTEAEIIAHIERAAQCMASCMADDGRIVINTMAIGRTKFTGGRREVDLLLDRWQCAFRRADWLLRNVRVWQKEGAYIAFSPEQDMQDMHWEFLGTFWKTPRAQNRNRAAWVTQGMWDIQPQIKDVGHSAPFPVEIPGRYCEIYTSQSDLLFEPYTGSGTTMVAAEQLGRRCFGMEISAPYVAVCLERMLMIVLEPRLVDKP